MADSTEDEGGKGRKEYDGKAAWKDSKVAATLFFEWLHRGNFVADVDANDNIDLSMIERDHVNKLFVAFVQQQHGRITEKQRRRLEGLVMSVLRRKKLLKTKRYNDGVVFCSFARTDKSFAPIQERKTARDKLRQERMDLQSNKGGVLVSNEPITNPRGPVLPINQNVTVVFDLELTHDAQEPMKLKEIYLAGSHKRHFQILTKTPLPLDSNVPHTAQLSFRATATAAWRANVTFLFENGTGKQFSILRSILCRSGDADMYDVLKPATPYVRQRRKYDRPVAKEDVVDPPKQQGGGGAIYNGLGMYKVPVDVRELVENKEMEAALGAVVPSYSTPSNDFSDVYTTFWQHLLWTSELQAYEDIKTFDLEDASLQHAGRFLKLYVAGLAEGRPSVLRGDLVSCTWNGKQYRGRVVAVELLDVLLEFHSSFHRAFNVSIDRVELVRFTFGRTAFRTAHAGVLRAPKTMGTTMLMPTPDHISKLQNNQNHRIQRICPPSLRWASTTLNEEQKQAVQEIIKANLRPVPYVIFGPPGTGKTTTVVEAVYQLARLHSYSAVNQQPKLKILLVAPSNDAVDILVEKLAPYFPPSEMIRVLAYTRPIDQVPSIVRGYCREGVEPRQLIPEIMTVQIVVATVNMAARLWCMGSGVHKGYFDVLCVDEAGHATEPEVIAVAASIMNFNGQSPGQLVLAGDPMQLGPIITSELCKKFGMDQSYMERLVKTSPAYALNGSDKYPSELVTLLVNNYRSHPDIIKLPNEMFYDNKLRVCGDHFATHSMIKWDHLPNKGFPVVFHAVDGENNREGNSPSWFNPQEALVVCDYVKHLVKHSKPSVRQEDIGIVTPYARQVQKIRIALKVHDLGNVKVGSVETFQGQERRVIIISTVRSENGYLDHDRKYGLGFVANEKRFNVAVTRAKALLIVVGSPRVLATDEKNWLPFLRFCRDNKSWLGEAWDDKATNEDDDFEIVSDKSEGEEDDDEWKLVTDQEVHGYINREE